MTSTFFFFAKDDERKSGDKKKKKNGAHTHVRTTVQLDEHNIHVGCCLFSHNSKKGHINQKRVMLVKRSLGLECGRAIKVLYDDDGITVN